MAPASKLVIADLAEGYTIGATPLREGLSRLVSEGLVRAIGQKGFRVAEVSREDLSDIIRMRSVIESEALRLSMRDGGDEWEAGIVASLYRLKRFAERGAEGVPQRDRQLRGRTQGVSHGPDCRLRLAPHA